MFQVRECLISCITCTSSIQHCQINSLHAGEFYMLFCLLLIFQNQLFRNTISVSLDPDQARGFVEPNLGPNCFQRLSAGNMSRQSINPKSANRNKSCLLFSSAEMFKKPLWQTGWTQIRLLLAVCSGSTLFASILNLSVMLGNYLQQTTSADDIFRCIFFLAL